MSQTSGNQGRGSGAIRHFTDLIVWQKAHAVSTRIFTLSKSFPPEEKFSLTDQIRRSARSIGANIAEAWAKRRYEAAFIAKLTDSDGESNETEHWLIEAESCEYLSPESVSEIRGLLSEVGKMLGAMMLNPQPFLLQK